MTWAEGYSLAKSIAQFPFFFFSCTPSVHVREFSSIVLTKPYRLTGACAYVEGVLRNGVS